MSEIGEFHMEKVPHRSNYYINLGLQDENWSEFLVKNEVTEEDTQKRFTGKSGTSAFEEAIDTVDVFLTESQKMGAFVKSNAKLLDFGCGWGRISKTATKYFEPESITSVDVYSGALDLVRKSDFPFNLVKAETSPPLSLSSGTFDFIFAYSVFSHLKEEKAKSWMLEFRRLLKPGGVIAVTTRPRGFISWTAKLREESNLPVHAKGSEIAFLDTEECLRRYDAGEFLFDQERLNGPLKDVGFGEACIPAAYVEKVWGPEFDKTHFVPAHEVRTSQSNIFCKK